MKTPSELLSRMSGTLDQDWAEARDWFAACDWSMDRIDHFMELFVCSPRDLHKIASPQEIDCIQRLARVAFFEAFKRASE